MYIFSILFCVLAALADVVGGAVTLFRKLEHKHLSMVTAIGSGFLLGATLLDRLPDAFHELPSSAAIVIVIGYLCMLLVERFVFRHDHSDPENDAPIHPSRKDVSREHSSTSNTSGYHHPIGIVAYVGMLIHTFMDGVVVAGSFSIDRGVGFLMFLAITMHKLPEGFSMASIMLVAGRNRLQAFRSTIGLALSTIAGGLLTVWVGAIDAFGIKIVMAFAAGTFLYITTSSLIPVVKNTKNGNNTKEILALVLSVAVFYGSLVLIQHVGLS